MFFYKFDPTSYDISCAYKHMRDLNWLGHRLVCFQVVRLGGEDQHVSPL